MTASAQGRRDREGLPPSLGSCAPLAADHPPVLTIIVDTEEEFDWDAPLERSAVSVTALDEIWRAQEIFDGYGIRPTYVVDWAVASQPAAAAGLCELRDSGRALIGAHLHPWINPPLAEELTPRNSFGGNLDRPVEAAKLGRLTEAIAECFGEPPTVFKAGRYGIGRQTPGLLAELGYRVDTSYCPSFDFSAEGGPDFSRCSPAPGWLGSGEGRIMELPMSSSFVGLLGRYARRLVRLAEGPTGRRLRLSGILSRSRLAERLVLSPEGFTPSEHRRLTRYLLAAGVRTLSWTFHSPSLKPGCTPYVRSRQERDRFLDSFRRYFDYFFGRLGGVTVTPLELRSELEAA